MIDTFIYMIYSYKLNTLIKINDMVIQNDYTYI